MFSKSHQNNSKGSPPKSRQDEEAVSKTSRSDAEDKSPAESTRPVVIVVS